jgi:hypothetical protein
MKKKNLTKETEIILPIVLSYLTKTRTIRTRLINNSFYKTRMYECYPFYKAVSNMNFNYEIDEIDII